MVGKPKYEYGDIVEFLINGEIKTGIVEIIDEWGTFENDSDVHYDVLCTEEKTLYKHLIEYSIIRCIGKCDDKRLVWYENN
jgi:hypothetical protein